MQCSFCNQPLGNKTYSYDNRKFCRPRCRAKYKKTLPEESQLEVNPTICPVCGSPWVRQSKGFLPEYQCADGHWWHIREGEVRIGPS